MIVLAARRRGWAARRLALLALGTAAALALWFQAHGAPTAPLRFATPASVTALAAVAGYALLGSDGDSALYRWVGVPLAVLATVVLIRTGYGDQAAPVQRLLGHPWMAAVGRHSYSLYLWHLVPFVLLEDASVPKPVAGLVTVGAAVLLTAASYRFLERPFLRPRSDVLRPLPLQPENPAIRERGNEVLS